MARECLVDGDVKASSPEELFEKRARFLNSIAPEVNPENYLKDTAGDFRKMQNLEEDSEVNLWFEDDLFCQVNFWFVCHLIHRSQINSKLFLVRPGAQSPYSFANYSTEGLKNLYANKVAITHLDKLSALWIAYQDGDSIRLERTAAELESTYPFIRPAVVAHLMRPAKPENSIREIITQLDTKDFGKVFQEFCKKESIYGFGDLQVKRIFDKVIQDLD